MNTKGEMGYDDLNIASLSYDDLLPGIQCYRPVEVGKTRNPNGTYSRDYKMHGWYKTKIGDIKESDYHKIGLEVIKNHNEEWIYERVLARVKTFPFLNSEEEQIQWAVDCTISKAYEAWIERGEFALESNAEPGQIDIFQYLSECEDKEADDDIDI